MDILEKALEIIDLYDLYQALLTEKQKELSKNSKALALPNATADICDEIEKLLKVESDNSSNKKKLIEDYSAKLVTAEKTLGAINVDPEVENAKLKELQIQIDDYKKQIDKLKGVSKKNNVFQKIKSFFNYN